MSIQERGVDHEIFTCHDFLVGLSSLPLTPIRPHELIVRPPDMHQATGAYLKYTHSAVKPIKFAPISYPVKTYAPNSRCLITANVDTRARLLLDYPAPTTLKVMEQYIRIVAQGGAVPCGSELVFGITEYFVPSQEFEQSVGEALFGIPQGAFSRMVSEVEIDWHWNRYVASNNPLHHQLAEAARLITAQRLLFTEVSYGALFYPDESLKHATVYWNFYFL